MREKNNLKERFITSALALPITLAALFFSTKPYFEPIFVLILAIIAIVSLDEFYKLAEKKGIKPLSALAKACTLGFMMSLFLAYRNPFLQALPWIVLLTSFILGFLYFFFEGKDPIQNLSTTVFGFIYVALPLSLILLILYQSKLFGEEGRAWLLYLLTVVKMTDIAAYFGGKKFGKTKLSPLISPKKTWEGAIIGFCASLASSVLFLFLMLLLNIPFSLSFFGSLILGAFLCIFSQISDLSESLLKRDAVVKDSSQLPGLGGLLDIIDSLIFPLPILYIWMQLFIFNGSSL